MTRVKSGVTAHRRHHKKVKVAKGYRGLRHKTFKQAKNAIMKAGLHSYVDRKKKKRVFRQLWIARINAACRENDINYSRFIDGMNKKGIKLNRKMLAELAANEPEAFKAVVETVK